MNLSIFMCGCNTSVNNVCKNEINIGEKKSASCFEVAYTST